MNSVDMSDKQRSENSINNVIPWLISDMENRLGQIQYGDPAFQAKIGEYLCSVFK